MKVLGIYGSPRKKGNTDILLDKVLEGALSAGAEVTLRVDSFQTDTGIDRLPVRSLGHNQK